MFSDHGLYRGANLYPLLTDSETLALAEIVQRWQSLPPEVTASELPTIKAGIAARNKLVCHNLRLVLKDAPKYTFQPMQVHDVVQAGMLGLIRAAEKYDPARKIRFDIYAVTAIRNRMLEYRRDCERAIRVPVSTLKKMKRPIEELTDLQKANRRNAERTQQREEELGDPIDHRMSAIDEATAEAELAQARTLVTSLLERLPPLQANALRMRYGLPPYTREHSQSEVAASMGMANGSFGWFERRAIRRMRSAKALHKM